MKIELRDIRKTYGAVEANSGINCTIPSGTICGILGENGAGKSTLMKILSGYVRADSGGILLNDRPVRLRNPADALRQGIGMLHQDPLDFPNLKLRDNFRLGAAGDRKRSSACGAKALRSLQAEFGFDLDPEAYVEALSVGERQQAELLRLLWMGADVLILDEPATGVTPRQKESIFNALRVLSGRGKTILLVSHKLEDVERLCRHIVVLRRGRLVGKLTPPFETGLLIRLMFGEASTPPAPPLARLPGEILFELDDLSIETPRFAMDHIRLSVSRGERIGLAGAAGNGQTPFLKVCAGLLPSTGGHIRFQGQRLERHSTARFFRLGIRHIPAGRLDEGLIPGLSLIDHVLLTDPARSFFIRRPKAAQRTQSLIDAYAIQGAPTTRVEQLSGGNQQRTLLALLPDDINLLLAEQPTRGLDVESSAAIWDKLRQRCAKGAAIIFNSSDPEEILAQSDRILVFSAGRIQGPFEPTSLNLEELGRLIGGKAPAA